MPTLVSMVSFRFAGFPTSFSKADPQFSVRDTSNLPTHLGNMPLCAGLASSPDFLQSILSEAPTPRTQVSVICCSEAFSHFIILHSL